MLQVDWLKQEVRHKAHSDDRLLLVDGMQAFILNIFYIIDKKVSQDMNKRNYMEFLYFLYEPYELNTVNIIKLTTQLAM